MRTPEEDAWITQKAAEEDGALVLAGSIRIAPCSKKIECRDADYEHQFHVDTFDSPDLENG